MKKKKTVTYRVFFQEKTFEDFKDTLFHSRGFEAAGCFVALDGDKVVGFIGTNVRDDNPKTSGYIHSLIVNKDYRRQGIGSKLLELGFHELELIAGQKPVVTKAKKSIANFKLREGMNIGCKVTLRGDKMYEFTDRLINIALPRVRDFRGVKANSFDGRGNYTMGIKEQLIFPEIEYDKVDKIRGMDIVFVTTAKTDEEARELLRLFGMPFAK